MSLDLVYFSCRVKKVYPNIQTSLEPEGIGVIWLDIIVMIIELVAHCPKSSGWLKILTGYSVAESSG